MSGIYAITEFCIGSKWYSGVKRHLFVNTILVPLKLMLLKTWYTFPALTLSFTGDIYLHVLVFGSYSCLCTCRPAVLRDSPIQVGVYVYTCLTPVRR